jgi:hypothetical protein
MDMIIQKFTPEEMLSKCDALERNNERTHGWLDHQINERQKAEKHNDIFEKQLKMSNFIAMMDNTAEFKRFAEFCGQYVSATCIKDVKEEMIVNPDKYLALCIPFKAKKREDEQKKKEEAPPKKRPSSRGANKRPRSEAHQVHEIE